MHTLELPKYQPPSDNEVVTDPLDQWAEFFCNAKSSTAEALQARLNSPVFTEAIGVRRMISQNPEQRRQYLERLKQQLDATALAFVLRGSGWSPVRCGADYRNSTADNLTSNIRRPSRLIHWACRTSWLTAKRRNTCGSTAE